MHIHTMIALLCTCVKNPNQDDWQKLVRLLKYCNGTRNDKLILSADDLEGIDLGFAKALQERTARVLSASTSSAWESTWKTDCSWATA